MLGMSAIPCWQEEEGELAEISRLGELGHGDGEPSPQPWADSDGTGEPESGLFPQAGTGPRRRSHRTTPRQ